MDKSFVAPDWPPLSDEEVRAVLRRYGQTNLVQKSTDAVVVWQSPRPMSAASLVRVGDGSVFVKRHHREVRTPEQLRVEHTFASYLHARGQLVPRVLTNLDGPTVVENGDFVYEVHEPIGGVDLYRDALSWSASEVSNTPVPRDERSPRSTKQHVGSRHRLERRACRSARRRSSVPPTRRRHCSGSSTPVRDLPTPSPIAPSSTTSPAITLV